MSFRQDQIEGMTAYIGDEVRKALERATRTCLTCEHFEKADEVCKLTWPKLQRPPAKIIAFGCDSYSDEIPF